MAAAAFSGFVILSGFATAAFGLFFMIGYFDSDRHSQTWALWAIVSALGVMQIGIGAIGRLLASLVQQKHPTRPFGPESDTSHKEIIDVLRRLNAPANPPNVRLGEDD